MTREYDRARVALGPRHWCCHLAGRTRAGSVSDLITFAQTAGLKKAKAMALLREVADAVNDWRGYAAAAGVSARDRIRIEKAFRIDLV